MYVRSPSGNAGQEENAEAIWAMDKRNKEMTSTETGRPSVSPVIRWYGIAAKPCTGSSAHDQHGKPHGNWALGLKKIKDPQPPLSG